MNIPRMSVKFLFTTALALTSLAGYLSLATLPSLSETKRPEAPDTGTPEGSSSAGGSRTGSPLDTACSKANKPFTALLATDNIDFTLDAHPTFWFYVPYAPDEIDYMEFVLSQPKARSQYRTAVALRQSGIIAISLPREAKYTLQPETDYKWNLNLKLNCNPNGTRKLELARQGWIRRVAKDSELQRQLETKRKRKYEIYRNSDLLYDAVTELALLRQREPENAKLDADWASLLELLGWKELSEEPLVELRLTPPEPTTTNFPLE